MPEKDPLLERQQLYADSLERGNKADGGLYTMECSANACWR